MLEGRLDLLLRRPSDGQRLVLDAKWTRSNRRHRAALAADEAVHPGVHTLGYVSEMLTFLFVLNCTRAGG